MDEDTEVIAIFLDDGAEAPDAGEVDFAATSCLLRDASGTISIRPARSFDKERLGLESSGVFRRSRPIRDPNTGEVIGYELEEDARIRVAIG